MAQENEPSQNIPARPAIEASASAGAPELKETSTASVASAEAGPSLSGVAADPATLVGEQVPEAAGSAVAIKYLVNTGKWPLLFWARKSR